MTAPVDAAAAQGQVQRCYISATPFADTCDSEAEFLAALATADLFVRADNILSDAKKDDSRATADRKERGRDFVITFTGGRVIVFTCKITKRPGNTAYDILATAYATNALIAVALATGDIATTGTKSQCFNAVITKFPEDQPDPGGVTHDIELKPAGPTAVVPTLVTKA